MAPDIKPKNETARGEEHARPGKRLKIAHVLEIGPSLFDTTSTSSLIFSNMNDQDIIDALENFIASPRSKTDVFSIYGKGIDIQSRADLSSYWSYDLLYKGSPLYEVIADDSHLQGCIVDTFAPLFTTPKLWQLHYLVSTDKYVFVYKGRWAQCVPSVARSPCFVVLTAFIEDSNVCQATIEAAVFAMLSMQAASLVDTILSTVQSKHGAGEKLLKVFES
jgi:hypothetical protein